MEKTLTLTLHPDSLKIFSPLFQEGIILKTQVNGPIRDFLWRHFGLSTDYQEARIQTLFLNGKAVDNPAKAIVRDGATLALSGAMPGLVGATLRRGGTFASLRQPITLSGSEEDIPETDGQVILKLFNLLVPEIGPLLLAKGFWVRGTDFDKLVGTDPKNFWSHWSPVLLNGQKMDARVLEQTTWAPESEDPILIKITFRPNPDQPEPK
jgi:hypothetical protein